MMAKVMTSQLLKNIRISKDVLDNMIGKPVLSSTGEVIGKISGHSENLAVIYVDFDIPPADESTIGKEAHYILFGTDYSNDFKKNK